jgi:hypothetical protein
MMFQGVSWSCDQELVTPDNLLHWQTLTEAAQQNVFGDGRTRFRRWMSILLSNTIKVDIGMAHHSNNNSLASVAEAIQQECTGDQSSEQFAQTTPSACQCQVDLQPAKPL